jgi:DNA-binding response OmpR family regulator
MARVLSISTDLMLGSKVQETLTAAGHEVTTAPALQQSSWEDVDLIVADLDVENPEALVGLGMPVLGYYSHVDVDTKKTAEAAGVDLVVPRSRMARELPALAGKLLTSA